MKDFIHNLIVPHKKGDTWDGIEIEYKEFDTDGVTEIPRDLTGVTVLSQFRKQGDGVVFFEFKTIDNTITIPNPTLGVVKFMPRIVLAQPGIYITDVQLTFPDGRVETDVAGSWEILQEISR